MTTDLERAFKALTNKQASTTTLWDYYDGNHPLRFSTERLKAIFGPSTRFAQNWAESVRKVRMNIGHI